MYTQCIKDTNNWSNITVNGKIIKDKVNGFNAVTKFGFPIIENFADTWPNPESLAKALGYLSGTEGIDTLITPVIDTNWRNPTGPSPYLLYIDQSSLALSWTYYIGKTWDATKVTLQERIQALFTGYAEIVGVQLDNDTLQKDIDDILNFEYLLANNYSSSADTRLQNARSYNLYTSTTFAAKYKNIDITAYLNELTTSSPNVSAFVAESNFTFSLMEPDKLTQVDNAITSSFGGAVTPRTFYNYLYFRLLNTNRVYYPTPIQVDEFLDRFQLQRSPRGKPRFIRKRRPRDMEKSDADEILFSCVDDTVSYFQYANARVFIDKVYPDNNTRTNLREHVRKVVEGILIGMQSMIDQLDWMTPASKQGAYNKIQNLVRNYAYPDFITDNNQLTLYYEELGDFTGLNYYQILNALQQFNSKISYELLLKTKVDRDDWNGPPGTVNAWYQPELNSITFPAAILRQPYFDLDWPVSVNYGAMGVIAGHELTHSFDSSGTQWDGIGALFGWLDDSSQSSFNDMAACVINEYNNFCPLNASVYSPNCINGAQTQGENVADNGGMHSAYRAYRNSINFDGSNPLLPGDPINLLTHDQLFFLSFAQVWCERPPPDSEIYTRLLVDPHSPSKYRVFGTVQNYPGTIVINYHCLSFIVSRFP